MDYKLCINILETYKRELETIVLNHEKDKMMIPSDDYDMDEDVEGYLEYLPNEVDVRKGHIAEVSSAIKFLRGDTKEIQKFFAEK